MTDVVEAGRDDAAGCVMAILLQQNGVSFIHEVHERLRAAADVHQKVKGGVIPRL